MKCLKGPVPRVVATASGEAAADQEMAHLLLAQELSGISRSDELATADPAERKKNYDTQRMRKK